EIGMEELWKEFSEKVEIFDPQFNAISQSYTAKVLFKQHFSELMLKISKSIKAYCEDKASLQSQLSAKETEAQEYRGLLEDMASGAYFIGDELRALAEGILRLYPQPKQQDNG
ncbi:MAG TPA: hypothetical protein VN922_12805, partial [Bacteroidia bacterium]|nr:hypothetical protein [Bacteroidia bacterium]